MVDMIPAWIWIQAIPTPALRVTIPAPDPYPQKRGIVTPLAAAMVPGEVESGERRKGRIKGLS